jgi:hypothetical protein
MFIIYCNTIFSRTGSRKLIFLFRSLRYGVLDLFQRNENQVTRRRSVLGAKQRHTAKNPFFGIVVLKMNEEEVEVRVLGITEHEPFSGSQGRCS